MNPIEIYDKLNALNYAVVEYKLGRENYSKEKILRMKKECLRFLALCASNNDIKRTYTPSPLVDSFWHQMILNTMQYTNDVTKACGRFMHHVPNGNKEMKKYNDEVSYWNTLEDYEKYFGEPDLEIWGIEKNRG